MSAHTLRKRAQANDLNLLHATGDDTFPVPRVESFFAGPTALLHYIYGHYLPAHHRNISKVILLANYASYSKEQLEVYFDAVERYFANLGVPVM